MSVIETSNPLAQSWLSIARDKDTPSEQFRRAMENLAMILFSEAASNSSLRHLVKKQDIKTPLKRTRATFIDEKNVYIIPILRAGLSMLPGIKNFVPMAKVAHVGLFRSEKTLQPHWYLDKLPKKISKKSVFFILEPMLATGGTITTVLQRVIILGAKKVFVLSALMSQHARERLEKKFHIVDFYVGSVDPEINTKGYIVPGLGDAGDRAFNL